MHRVGTQIKIMTAQSFKDQAIYWQSSAQRNLRTSEDLFKTKHYDSCLFFCHLSLEKALKGMIVKNTRQSAPYIHDLEKLAVLANIPLDDKIRIYLRIISTFNIAARYDDVKLDFYKRCTKSYTKKYLTITKEIYVWLKKYYQNK